MNGLRDLVAARLGFPASEKLSFNLVNEPIVTPAPAQMEELKKAGKLKPEDFFNGEFGRSHAADYTRCPRGHRSDYKA